MTYSVPATRRQVRYITRREPNYQFPAAVGPQLDGFFDIVGDIAGAALGPVGAIGGKALSAVAGGGSDKENDYAKNVFVPRMQSRPNEVPTIAANATKSGGDEYSVDERGMPVSKTPTRAAKLIVANNAQLNPVPTGNYVTVTSSSFGARQGERRQVFRPGLTVTEVGAVGLPAGAQTGGVDLDALMEAWIRGGGAAAGETLKTQVAGPLADVVEVVAGDELKARQRAAAVEAGKDWLLPVLGTIGLIAIATAKPARRRRR